jgi:hypothetical protein
MALCSVPRFTLSRNVDNEFIFTVKENGTTTPMVIDPQDTFLLKLVLLEDNETIDFSKYLEVETAIDGRLRFFITKEEVDELVSERGPKPDRYYLKPVYKLYIEANTVVNGVFVATIGQVYVG